MVAATNHEHEQVDGVRNAKVHSIFFEDLPITSAAFTGVDQVREVLGIGVDMDVNKQKPNTQAGKPAELHGCSCFSLSTLPLAVASIASRLGRLFPIESTALARPLPNAILAMPIPAGTLFYFQAIVTGRRSFFYSYDVATGKVIKIARIFSSGRAEKHVETFAASPDGQWLAFIGSGGDWFACSDFT